jgi:hypothetical protein
VTAGAEVGGQVDMSAALKNLRNFQNSLTEWKVEDGLPAVTMVVIAHTDKKGQALFGSVAQFADCDVLYMLERNENATDQATLTCIGARDIEEPPAITIGLERVPIVTAKGNEFNLVVSKEVSILDQPAAETRQTKQDAKKAATEINLDDLALRTLLGFYRGPHSWTKWSDWFELTRAARGKSGLGDGTFSATVKRLIDAGQVQKSSDGLYQIVFGANAGAGVVTPASAFASTSASDFSPLRGGEVQKSEVTSGSTSGSARSNSTESRVDQNSVVPDAAYDAPKPVVSEPAKVEIEGDDVAAQALKHLTEKTG